MKKCTKCNISYADDKKFCKKCGSSLIQEYNIDPKEIAKKSVLEEKLKADSLNAALLLEYSQFLYSNLLFKEAVPYLLKILAINENDEQAKELLLKSYLKLSMFTEAQEIGIQLLENKTTDIFLIEELAEIESHLGNNSKAIEYFETILKLQPTNIKALYGKAIILLTINELEKAIKNFKKLYEEGKSDRIVTIYAGIDKCLSDNYDKAIEILTLCLSNNKTALSDVHNQRGFLYLVYSLCKTQKPISKIDEWFALLDFDIITNFLQPIDEETLAKTISEIISIYYAGDSFKKDTDNIQYVINNYINASNICFTKHTHKYVAEIWNKISDIQESSGLLEDAQSSLNKATSLSSHNTEYKRKLNEVATQSKKHKKQQKRKTFTIIGFLITLIVVIIISVNLFNRHKENKAWEKASQNNTEASYQDYLYKYQDGRYAKDAKGLKEDVLWEKVKEFNTVEFYDDYLGKYPNGKYISEARDLKEDAFWEVTLAENNLEAYERYFSIYPYGKYVVEFEYENKESKVYGIIKYVGQIKNGLKEGIGIGKFETNHDNKNWNWDYSGEWKNDKRHGLGNFFSNWGFEYLGNFRNGEKHGLGKIKFVKGVNTGNEFEGKFINDIMSDGIYTFSSGDQYVGKFNKKRNNHGKCKYYDKDTGKWYYGNLYNGNGKLYNGSNWISFGDVTKSYSNKIKSTDNTNIKSSNSDKDAKMSSTINLIRGEETKNELKKRNSNIKFIVGKKSNNNIFIEDISITENETIISIKSNRAGTLHGPNHKYGYYIIDKITGKKYKLRNASIDFEKIIPINKTFELHFEKLPENVKYIDLLEGKCLNGCWNFYNIVLESAEYENPLNFKIGEQSHNYISIVGIKNSPNNTIISFKSSKNGGTLHAPNYSGAYFIQDDDTGKKYHLLGSSIGFNQNIDKNIVIDLIFEKIKENTKQISLIEGNLSDDRGWHFKKIQLDY